MRLPLKALLLAASCFSPVLSSTTANEASIIQETHITTTTVLDSNIFNTFLNQLHSALAEFGSSLAQDQQANINAPMSSIDPAAPPPGMRPYPSLAPTNLSSPVTDRGANGAIEKAPGAYCWQIFGCVNTFKFVQSCFDTMGGLINPNDEGQSKGYQGCLCDANKREFRNVLDAQQCTTCFTQQSLDLLLTNLLAFLQLAHAPSTFTPLSPALSRITSLSPLFTSASGLNERNDDAPAGGMTEKLNWIGTLSADPSDLPAAGLARQTQSFPTESMGQMPSYWPYHSPAPARKPGVTRTWTLWDDWSEEDRVIGVVVASVAWYPRGLGKQGRMVERRVGDGEIGGTGTWGWETVEAFTTSVYTDSLGFNGPDGRTEESGVTDVDMSIVSTSTSSLPLSSTSSSPASPPLPSLPTPTPTSSPVIQAQAKKPDTEAVYKIIQSTQIPPNGIATIVARGL